MKFSLFKADTPFMKYLSYLFTGYMVDFTRFNKVPGYSFSCPSAECLPQLWWRSMNYFFYFFLQLLAVFGLWLRFFLIIQAVYTFFIISFYPQANCMRMNVNYICYFYRVIAFPGQNYDFCSEIYFCFLCIVYSAAKFQYRISHCSVVYVPACLNSAVFFSQILRVRFC